MLGGYAQGFGYIYSLVFSSFEFYDFDFFL